MTKKQLRKPEYWTDFEDLCKRLWTEVWEYPETRKHGRNGEAQQGVDIYGRNKGTNGFIGIQCKGKDDYSNKQLTEREIDKEIENAKDFKPLLSKFYFATTSNRSAKIEEYIRRKGEENRSLGLFEVHVFFWEDIAELIDEYKVVHDWYLHGQGFKISSEAQLTFTNDLEVIECKPKYVEYTTSFEELSFLKLIDYKIGIEQMKKHENLLFPRLPKMDCFEDYVKFMNKDHISCQDPDDLTDPQPIRYGFDLPFVQEKHNLGVNVIKLKLKNSGTAVIEDYKVYLNFKGTSKADTVNKGVFFDSTKYSYDVHFNDVVRGEAVFEPAKKVLVQNDSLFFDDICFKCHKDIREVFINWKLVSRGYENAGILRIMINPTIEEHRITKFVEDPTVHPPYAITTSKYEFCRHEN